MLNFFRNAFSSLISFALVPSIIALLLIISFTGVYLDKATFISTLKNNNTFSKISSDIIPPLLVNLGNKEGQANIPEEVTTKIVKNIDKTKLSKDLELLVSNAHDYVTGKTENFNTRIEIGSYIDSIETNLKPEFTNYLDSLPTCSETQLQELSNEEGPNSLSCRPKNQTTEQILENLGVNQLTQQLSENSPKALVVTETEVKTDPEIIKLDEINQKKDANKSSLQNLRTIVKNIDSSKAVFLTVIGLLSLLLIASRLPKLSSSFKWLSSTLLSASIFPFVFGFLMLIFAKPDMFQGTIKSIAGLKGSSQFEVAITSLVSDNLASFFKTMSQNLFINSLILIAVSIVFFFVHLYLQRKTDKAPNPSIDSKKPLTP